MTESSSKVMPFPLAASFSGRTAFDQLRKGGHNFKAIIKMKMDRYGHQLSAMTPVKELWLAVLVSTGWQGWLFQDGCTAVAGPGMMRGLNKVSLKF